MAHSNSSANGPVCWQGRDLILRVQVQPRASCNEFAGQHGNAVKIRLTAPPVEGKANAALCAFLAKAFGVPKNQVRLLRGDTARHKTVQISAPAGLPEELNFLQNPPT